MNGTYNLHTTHAGKFFGQIICCRHSYTNHSSFFYLWWKWSDPKENIHAFSSIFWTNVSITLFNGFDFKIYANDPTVNTIIIIEMKYSKCKAAHKNTLLSILTEWHVQNHRKYLTLWNEVLLPISMKWFRRIRQEVAMQQRIHPPSASIIKRKEHKKRKKTQSFIRKVKWKTDIQTLQLTNVMLLGKGYWSCAISKLALNSDIMNQ